MAEKLKSITRQIPWSLLLKAGLLALLWSFTPTPVFLALAALFYFVPLFRPGLLFPQFLAILLIANFLAQGFWEAWLIGGLFFLLFGIKDLAFLARPLAYETLAELAIFTGAMAVYAGAASWSFEAILMILVLAAIFYIFLRPIPWQDGSAPRAARADWPAQLSTLLFLEMGFLLLFLPMDFLYQAAILFLFGILLVEILSKIRQSEINLRGILYYAAGFAICAGFVLGLNNWRI